MNKPGMHFSEKINRDYLELTLMYIISAGICLFFPWAIKHLAGLTAVDFHIHYKEFANISDVRHYIDIAKDGYVTTGDERLSLVFYPFYPIVIRIVHMITRLDYHTAASVISFAASYSSVFILYRLVQIDYDKKTAFRAAKFYLISPFIFFTFTRMSESLYLLLLFGTIYLLRKGKYIPAGILGFFTAFTRLPGLAVGVIMLTESIAIVYKDIKNGEFAAKKYLKPVVMMIMTLCGFITYLGINYHLYKDPFMFLKYQEENWHQRFTNPVYVIKNVLIDGQLKGGYSLNIKIGCAAAGLLAIAAILFSIVIAVLIKVRLSYILYMLVYFYVCYSASWLLSGARYSLGAFCIFLVFGVVGAKHRHIDNILTILSPVCMLFFAFVCSIGGMY